MALRGSTSRPAFRSLPIGSLPSETSPHPGTSRPSAYWRS
ncbi:hypothetical protein [Azospirillum endophyticum]